MISSAHIHDYNSNKESLLASLTKTIKNLHIFRDISIFIITEVENNQEINYKIDFEPLCDIFHTECNIFTENLSIGSFSLMCSSDLLALTFPSDLATYAIGLCPIHMVISRISSPPSPVLWHYYIHPRIYLISSLLNHLTNSLFIYMFIYVHDRYLLPLLLVI
jgi:hypothetical protein